MASPMTVRAAVVIALASLAFCAPTASASDPTAIVTEVRKGQGEIRVRGAGDDTSRPARPLMPLRPGDVITLTKDARAVVVLSGGASAVLSSERSPYTVPAPAPATSGQTVRAVATNVTQFLLAKQKPPAYATLASRAGAAAARTDLPLILAPRETRLAPGPVTFRWSGPDVRYTVRVFGPEGMLWSAMDLERGSVAYPSAAPALRPGVLYVWELATPGRPADRAQFELMSPAEMAAVEADLGVLRPETSGYPRSTTAVFRAARLYQDRLLQGALDELLAIAATDPGEPTVHEMIGHVYDAMGLRHHATQAFATARALVEK